jgi:hypothetical protein
MEIKTKMKAAKRESAEPTLQCLAHIDGTQKLQEEAGHQELDGNQRQLDTQLPVMFSAIQD